MKKVIIFMSKIVHIRVAKAEMMRLHKAGMQPAQPFILKINSPNGLPYPFNLTPAQIRKAETGQKTILLSTNQMKKMQTAGFISKIPIIGPLLSGLFGKGNSSESWQNGSSINGGMASELFPLVRSILTYGKGQGLSDSELHGGIFKTITGLIGSLFGKGFAESEQTAGFISAIAKELLPKSIDGMASYFSTPRGSSIEAPPVKRRGRPKKKVVA